MQKTININKGIEQANINKQQNCIKKTKIGKQLRNKQSKHPNPSIKITI